MEKLDDKAINDLFNAAVEFLKSNGWKSAVIGGVKIEQRESSFRYNYQLVVSFTGVPAVDLEKAPKKRSLKKGPV